MSADNPSSIPDGKTQPDSTEEKKSAENPITKIISKLKAIFNKSDKEQPYYGGHFGITEEQLGWDKKIKKSWLQSFERYANRSEEKDELLSKTFFDQIQISTQQNELYYKFFWDEIWDARINQYPYIQEKAWKMISEFYDKEKSYFWDKPKLIFEELSQGEIDSSRFKFGEKICYEIFETQDMWYKDHFSVFHDYLWKHRDYLEEARFEELLDDKKSKRKKKRKRNAKKKNKNKNPDAEDDDDNEDEKEPIPKPFAFDFYFYIWSELLDKHIDWILGNWSAIQAIFPYYEMIAEKKEQKATQTAIEVEPPTYIEYMTELIIESMDRIVEERDLPEDLIMSPEDLSMTLISQIVALLMMGTLKGKKRLIDKIFGFILIYLHKHPETFNNYHQVSSWINQDQCLNLPFMIFDEIISLIYTKKDEHLCELYFNDFITHLSYGSQLVIKKSIKVIYFIHNEMQYFASPKHFESLIHTLDIENKEFHEHILYLIFENVKKQPNLIFQLTPTIKIGLEASNTTLRNQSKFFLKLVIELVYRKETQFNLQIFRDFQYILLQNYEDQQVNYIIASLLQYYTQNHLDFILPYREFIESQIEYYAFNFEIKAIYIQIRLKLIRTTLILDNVDFPEMD